MPQGHGRERGPPSERSRLLFGNGNGSGNEGDEGQAESGSYGGVKLPTTRLYPPETPTRVDEGEEEEEEEEEESQRMAWSPNTHRRRLGPKYADAVWRAASTLGASILGTGLLSMPQAVKLSGVGPFVLVSMVAATAAHITGLLLARTVAHVHLEGEFQGDLTYAKLAAEVFGSWGEFVTLVSLFVQQTGACVGYVVVVGDVFTPLVRIATNSPFVPEWTVRFLFAWAVMFPLSIIARSVRSLGAVSFAAVVSIAVFSVTVMGNALVVATNPDYFRSQLVGGVAEDLDGPDWWPTSWERVVRGVPLVVFAYFAHFNVVPVKNNLRESLHHAVAVEAYDKASTRAFVFSTAVTVGIGLAGYYSFLSETRADILTNFPVTGTYVSPVMNFVRALYGVGLLLAFPVVLFELREISVYLLFGRDATEAEYWAVTFSVVALTSFLGCAVADIATVFAVVGSTSTPILSFCLPCAVYLWSGASSPSLASSSSPSSGDGAITRVLARVLLLAGLGLIPLGIVGSLK